MNREPQKFDLKNIVLKRGAHGGEDGACCLFEAVSLYMGCEKTDHPEGVSPVLNSMGIGLNDSFPADDAGDKRRTELLAPFIERLPGSKGSDALELKRQYALLDWAVREYAPRWYEMVEALKPHAWQLRDLPAIVDLESAKVALQAVGIARDAAGDHYDGVRDGVLDGVLDGVRAGVLAGVRDGVLDEKILARLKAAEDWSDGYYIGRDLKAFVKKEDLDAQLKRVNDIGTEIELSAIALFDRLLSMKESA